MTACYGGVKNLIWRNVMNLFNLLYELETSDDYHISRLLILLKIFGGKNLKPINGITKLVKLDFLLRYPLYLTKILSKTKQIIDFQILPHEKHSVESRMIRYKYGPWDPRYRRFLNIMASKNLIKIEKPKRTIYIGLTERGDEISSILYEDECYIEYINRSRIIKKHFDIRGTDLKNLIYQTFPEIVEMSYGDII